MRRRVAVLLVLPLLAAVCGGKVADLSQDDGTLAPDGTFYGKDGKPIFSPGSACNGYAPASFNLLQPGGDCDPNGCQDWAAQRVPPGLPLRSDCGGAPCSARVPTNTGDPTDPAQRLHVTCHPGPSGDAFCKAFFQQFVLGDASVPVRCAAVCNYERVGDDGGCTLGPDVAGCVMDLTCDDHCSLGGPTLCVTRGSTTSCEPPCTPVSP